MGETLVTDGRANRAAKTRTAVVDALLALIDGGNLRPTAREIATRAGVSLRSVYVHFDDVESLFVAAAARHRARMERLRGPLVVTGPFEERLTALLESHRRVYEAGRQVVRAALLQEPASPVLRQALEAGRVGLRAEVEQVFGPELAAVGAAERARALAALEVLVGFGTWETLRRQQGLTPEQAGALVADMVRAVLGIWHLPAPDGVAEATSDVPRGGD